MHISSRPSARPRRFARSALALTGLLVAAASVLASAASATAPHGSHGEVILETRDTTGQPYNASLKGWWGHEGGTNDQGKRPTILSMDASDGHGVVDAATTAALHKAIDDGGQFDSLRVAFVPYSADGSNEHPQVHAGENAGQAFKWFADLGFGSALNGTTNKNDLVRWVSTLEEYTKWWDAGRPVQSVDDHLGVLDIQPDKTAKPSAAPEGKSILDRWPAGTKVSLVFYVSDGYDKQMPQLPTVKVGADGRAITSWLTFETVASPTNAARTSGGYRVLTGAGTGPHAAAKPKPAGSTSSSTDGQQTTAGGSASGSGSATSSTSGSSAQDAENSSFMSSFPGGQPMFWVFVGLLAAVCVAGAAAWRLRAASADAPAPTAVDSPAREPQNNVHH